MTKSAPRFLVYLEAMVLPVNRCAKRLRRDGVIMPLSDQPFQSIVATCRPENVDSALTIEGHIVYDIAVSKNGRHVYEFDLPSKEALSHKW
jgi:hypothetical protein